MTPARIRHWLFGPPRDVFDANTRRHIALVTFMAWIGLGADGLSSSAYGPAEAFLALGEHTELAIYLAIASAITVFIISIAYIQVMELFPNGGGGYKVASTLIGPKAGLVSGSALIVDYVLTIAISVASGTDAMFSLVPLEYHHYKIATECFFILLLLYMNLRGTKESIKILTPIFLGFVVSHVFMVVYGIMSHSSGLTNLMPQAKLDSQALSQEAGWFFVVALFLKAFSLGGGTYTGLESVSNSVNRMAEPRVRTGRYTMLMVAFSLAFMAAGITILYLLWDVSPEEGKTLNAIVFEKIISEWKWSQTSLGSLFLPMLLFFQAGLLFVAANTGFLAGPVVLSNMGADRWMPHFFTSLSSRLVIKNGIAIMGLAAIATILITRGQVSMLVVLYSINVFLTFSLSLFGLCLHWWREKTAKRRWRRFGISAIGLCLTSMILVVTVVEKFADGGWLTIIITSLVIFTGWRIHKRYEWIHHKIEEVDELFASSTEKRNMHPPAFDPKASTAALIMHETAGSGMHTLLWIMRLFPGVFKNFIFISVGEVDADTFAHEDRWHSQRQDLKKNLEYCVNYCHNHGLAATSYIDFGTDKLDKLHELTDKVIKDFPKAMFFGGKIVFEEDNLINLVLHNQTAYSLQRRLHYKGHNMIILPMKV